MPEEVTVKLSTRLKFWHGYFNSGMIVLVLIKPFET